MSQIKSPDFEHMDDALDILKNIPDYLILKTEMIPDGVRIQGFEKGFWSKKLVYTLTVELIKDFEWVNLDPDFDDKYIRFTKMDRWGTSEFISNYGCLINAPANIRKELLEDAEKDGIDPTTLVGAFNIVEKYEQSLKHIEVFQNINH